MKSTVDRNLIGEEKKPNVLQSVCDEKGSCVASAVKVFISILFVYGPLSLVEVQRGLVLIGHSVATPVSLMP